MVLLSAMCSGMEIGLSVCLMQTYSDSTCWSHVERRSSSSQSFEAGAPSRASTSPKTFCVCRILFAPAKVAAFWRTTPCEQLEAKRTRTNTDQMVRDSRVVIVWPIKASFPPARPLQDCLVSNGARERSPDPVRTVKQQGVYALDRGGLVI